MRSPSIWLAKKAIAHCLRARLASLARRHGFQRPNTAGPTAIDQLAHGRNGDRPEGGARDIVDFIENFAQGMALRRRRGSPSVLLDGVQVLEQLDYIQQRCSPYIAGELVSTSRATNRTDEASSAHDVHYLRQVVTGNTVLPADLGDGKLTAFARGEFENREDGKPGRNLQPHDIAIRM
jgi:hypothetical protein